MELTGEGMKSVGTGSKKKKNQMLSRRLTLAASSDKRAFCMFGGMAAFQQARVP